MRQDHFLSQSLEAVLGRDAAAEMHHWAAAYNAVVSWSLQSWAILFLSSVRKSEVCAKFC